MLKDLVSFLEGNAGIQAAGVTKAYPLLVPQKATLPAICYKQTSHEFDYVMEGDSHYHKATVSLAIGALTYDAVTKAGNAVIAALSGYKGTMGSTRIESIFVKDEADDLVISDTNEQQRVFGKEIEIEITYSV